MRSLTGLAQTALGVSVALAAWLAHPAARAQTTPVAIPLLEQYAKGEFAAVERELHALDEDGRAALLKGLETSAAAWTDAVPAERDRRRLAAATFALEAARAGEWDQWKLIQGFDNMGSEPREIAPGVMTPGVRIVPEPALIWAAAPKLIEWGCQLLRQAQSPTPNERLWHLAAVAVAERSEDFEFLIGSPWEGRGDRKDEFDHLTHAAARFPAERRFALAQAVAIESRLFQHPPKMLGAADAIKVLAGLENDPDIGGEAAAHLGLIRFRQLDYDGARKAMNRVEDQTRDPYLRYLARYVRGRAAEAQKKPMDAEKEYRAALAVWPRAQAASFSLAALVSSRGLRAEAASIVAAALKTPVAADPWREFIHGDDRFWPQWITELRGEILK